MKAQYFRKIGLMSVLVVGIFFAFNVMNKPEANTPDNVLKLQPPPFLNTVLAAPLNQAGTSFLEDEAGISAYTQISSGSIDLTQVRNAFRTIEYETADYLIGSVAIPDYQESHDVHVYVNTSGWVVAYYRAEEPAAKIIDLRHFDGATINSKLKMAMDNVLVEIGVVSFTTSYYDFRHPNATKLMLIAEKNGGAYNQDFDLQLPDTFTFYERSWAHYHDGDYRGSYLYLNDTLISGIGSGYHYASDFFTPAQLPPSAYHTLKITGSSTQSAGVALIYNEGL